MQTVNRSLPLPLRRVILLQRVHLRLTLEQVAERLRVTPDTVGKWERGVRRIELGKLPRLAAALDLNPFEFCRHALSEYHPAVAACLFESPAMLLKRIG